MFIIPIYAVFHVNESVSFHKRISEYLTWVLVNLRNRWFLVLLMFFCYPVTMIPCRGGCQLEKVKLLSHTYICRKVVFLSISLLFATAEPPAPKATGPGHCRGLCPQSKMPLPEVVMGGILKHLLPFWVIPPKPSPMLARPSCAPAHWHKSGKTQMWGFLFGKWRGTGSSYPPSFTQSWITPNLGKGFRWPAAQMVTKVYQRQNKMLTNQMHADPCHL